MRSFPQTLLLTATIGVVLLVSSVPLSAQTYSDMLMASLEEPFEPNLPPLVTSERPVRYAEIDTANVSFRPAVIELTANSSTYVEPYVEPCETAACGPTACVTTTECCLDDDCSWLEKKWNSLSKKAYFNRHRRHSNTLYPVARPYCLPGYGYHETCWRRMSPNPCPICPSDREPAPHSAYPELAPPPAPGSSETTLPYDR